MTPAQQTPIPRMSHEEIPELIGAGNSRWRSRGSEDGKRCIFKSICTQYPMPTGRPIYWRGSCLLFGKEFIGT